MAVAITATEQDVWPVRRLVAVTGLTVGDQIAVYRVVSAQRTVLRGSSVTVTDTSFTVVDSELPFGVPVSYVVAVAGIDVASTSPETSTLAGGKVAVTDAVTGLAAEVFIYAAPKKTYSRRSTTFTTTTGRNLIVAQPYGGARVPMELQTNTLTGAILLKELLMNATGSTVQIRQAGGYSDVDGYYAVEGEFTTSRTTQDYTNEVRRTVFNAVEVEPWPIEYSSKGYTYQDVIDHYAGLTYADMVSDYSGKTYLDLITTDWG